MTPRERAIAWATEVVADPAAVFLDLETTGLGPDSEIVDIAIVDVAGRIVLDTLVLPLGDIPEAAAAVHGITVAMCERAKAPMWTDLWPRVATILHPGRRIVVFNAAYDFWVIQQVTRAAKRPEFAPGWQCAMLEYASFDGTMTERRVRRGARWITVPGLKWHKLGEACAAMGMRLDGAHRALADAEACRRLVLAMAGQATQKDAPAEQGRLVFGVDTNLAEWADVPERFRR